MFSVLIHRAWFFVQVLIGFSLLWPVVLHLFYNTVQLAKKKVAVSEELADEKDYAIIVHLQTEWEAAALLMQSLVRLSYSNYLIYVVADAEGTIPAAFYHPKVVLLTPGRQCMGAKNIHRFAIDNFVRSHTHVTILKQSNIVKANYLNNLNVRFNEGYQAVQGSCVVVSSSRMYNWVYEAGAAYNRIFTGGLLFSLRSSALLTGYGMAFTTSYYKQCLQKLPDNGGSFITGLQTIIINKGHQIAFAAGATVGDKKAAGPALLVKQHANRINGWVKMIWPNCRLFVKGIVFANINQVVFSIQCLRLPLFTNLLGAAFCAVINKWLHPATAIVWMWCLLLFAVYCCTVFVSTEGMRYIGNSFFSPGVRKTYPAQSLQQELVSDLYSALP